MSFALAALLTLGCTPVLPPEVDVPLQANATFGEFTLDSGTLYQGNERVIERVYAAPVGDTSRVYVAADGVDNGTIYLLTTEGPPLAVVVGGRPDRLALGPDGTLAYVSGITGLASVWVRTPDGATRQLTNVGVVPTPGARPEQFVDPPRSSPVFAGDLLRWDGGEVRWR